MVFIKLLTRQMIKKLQIVLIFKDLILMLMNKLIGEFRHFIIQFLKLKINIAENY